MASKYDGLAKIIIQNVGGKSNIISVAHCITRLRFRLKDVSKANTEVLEATDGVIKVLNAGGQYQVVVGQAVTDIYDAVLAAGHLSGVGETDEDGNLIESDAVADDGDKSPIARFVDMISAIIQPALAGLAAAGIMKGVLALCTFMGWMQATDGAYLIWNGFADGFFYFLPVILGYTASKRFKCSEFIGMTLGFALTYPALVAITKADVLGTIFAGTPFSMSYYMTFFGIPVIMPLSGYTSSVIPIIIAVFVASKLEHFFRGFFPENFKFAFVPLCTLVIMAPLTYLVIGPIATLLCDVLQLAFSTLFGIPVVGGLLGGLVLAGVWQVLVVFGLHWSVIAITLINVAALGYDYVLSAYMVCSFAQSMAVLAIILRTKDEKLKSLAWPAFITGLDRKSTRLNSSH